MKPTSLILDGKTLDVLQKIKTREEIEALVRKETLLHATDRSQNTMLHMAARWKNIVLAKYLIESGCTIDAKNDLGQTPLVLAVENNCEDIVEILMNAGAEINIEDNHGKNTLQIIGEYTWTSAKIFQYLLEKLQLDCLNNKEFIATKVSEAGWSLHNIVKINDVGLTELLLQRGYATKIDARDRSGQTALHVAVKSVDVGHVNLLLKNNADVHIADRNQRTVFSYVYDDENENASERFSILKMLIDKNTNLGSITKACDIYFYSNRETINLLLNANVGLSEPFDKVFILDALVTNKNPGVIEELRGRNYFENITNHTMQRICCTIIVKIVNVQTVEFLMKELLNACCANEIDFASMLIYIFRSSSTDGIDFLEQYKICVQTFLEYGTNVRLKIDYTTASIERDSTIIKVIVNNNLFELGKLVLCHLAFQEGQGTSVAELSRVKINSNDQFKTYFESCEQRLKTKIYDSITLFDLLTIVNKKLELYVRNPELLSKIQDTLTVLSEYEYFQILLQKRSTPALIIAELKMKTAPIICKIMETSYDTFPFIADIIVNFLEQQDMKNLMKALP